MWRLNWGWRIHTQDVPLIWLLEDFSPGQINLSTDLLECPQAMSSGFPRNEWSQTEAGGNFYIFYDLVLEVTGIISAIFYWLCNAALFTMGVGYARVWITGVSGHREPLRGWLLNLWREQWYSWLSFKLLLSLKGIFFTKVAFRCPG